jgi:hypothetical protein
VLWASRGHPGAIDDVTVTIDAHAQSCSMARLTGPDRRGVFTPDRVAIETASGQLLQARQNPRASFDRSIDTPWDDLQLAYFAGYAMWTYLTVPFLLAQPGFLTKVMMAGLRHPREMKSGLQLSPGARLWLRIRGPCADADFSLVP